MKIDVTFRNEYQKDFFWHRERNGLFDGGFGNGKTYAAMERAAVHLMNFNNYGMAICRQKFKTLKATTMKTFWKIVPWELVYKHDEQTGFTVFKNKSFIYWMHLDTADEQDLRGLEINSACIDQAEETKESLYLVLDARIGRWDKVEVPDRLLIQQIDDVDVIKEITASKGSRRSELIHKFTAWPKNKWGAYRVPNYMDVLCNPSEEDEFHWTFRRYNPESLERHPTSTHFYIHAPTDKELYDPATYAQMLTRDPEWIRKYVEGKTGTPKAIVHTISPDSIINPDEVKENLGETFWDDFVEKLVTKGSLVRVLDHGETGVTTCIWAATLNGVHIIYREYYVTSTLISINRQNIHDLSFYRNSQDELIEEEFVGNFADPAIFKKTTQKVDERRAGFWTVSREYKDTAVIDAPPIFWSPADNNEFATRNRINELIALSTRNVHPITNDSPAPGIYFLARTTSYPYGCKETIKQTNGQRRKLIGEDNGRKIYSEERDKNIIDHAYDTVRYLVAMHNTSKGIPKRRPPKRSFAYFNSLLTKKKAFREMSR